MNYQLLMKSETHKEVWSKLSANEFGRLANGVGNKIKGTKTIKFIHKHEVPGDRRQDVTYGQFVCSIRPKKSRATPNTFHRRRRQSQLPRRSRNPNGRNASCKTPFQQRHLNNGSQVYDNGHLKFLPHDTTDKAGIHTHKNEQHTGRNHQRIQFTPDGDTGQQHLHPSN